MIDEHVDGGEPDRLAPVTPLFGSSIERAPSIRSTPTRAFTPTPARTGGPRFVLDDEPDLAADEEATSEDDRALSAEQLIAAAEQALLKKLRTRSLSIREATTVLRGHDISAESVEDILETCERRGYLNDTALAEQLVYAATSRLGQGRQSIAQTMTKRGIPRDIADHAMAELPDDDLERALEFAQKKARSMSGGDPQAALRRLVGQLSRRGYPSNVAMTAAKQALAGQERHTR